MDKENEGLRPEDLIGDDPQNPNTPAQMLEALISKAIDTGSLRPLGQALGGVQSQMDGVFGMFQANMQRFGQILGTQSMQGDTMRMAFIAMIDLLIEKEVFSQEEWDSLYEEKVQKKMEERMENARKRHEEAIRGAVDEEMGMTKEELEEEEAEEATHVCSCGKTPEESCSSCPSEEKPEEDNSNVVLASEREGSIKHYPAKKE